MFIEKRITLKNNVYFIRVLQEYKSDKNGNIYLAIKDYIADYYDGGDFSILIKKIEESYTKEKAEAYSSIGYLGDILYIYDRVPFLCGIKDIYLTEDNIISSEGYISKDEIEKIILENNICMNKNNSFKLGDERTWFI